MPLLHSKKAVVLEQVDDLMASFTGSKGTGDEQRLEWSGNQITAFAQVIKKGYVALAVTAADDCTTTSDIVPEVAAPETSVPEETAPAVGAMVEETEVEEAPASSVKNEAAEFELEGRLKHAAAEDDWVDVMGVVTNNSGVSYSVASFDISLYDNAGDLICVDTVSVNQLREGQERAFRGAIRCADYVTEDIASWKLQFAGGH